ncbi:MAG: PAS domain S-box protein, partial [Deltaproteobacteria bacterium]|nr:PAS domain S-box protein [Deltaproteobacteria bacterium]
FSEASGTDDLFNKIAESLRLLTGAIAATFSLYDRDGQSLKLSSLSVDPVSSDTVRSFFGPEIFAMSMPVSSAAMEEMITQGIGRPKDLRELSFGTIPQEVSDTAMEAFGCRHLIALAVNYSGEVLGTCVAYLSGDQPVVPDDALKTFAYLSGMALKRRRDEDQLRESEEKYRTILESIEDGYWEVDLEGRFTFFNDAMCRISGQTREKLIGVEAYRDATPETAERMFKAFEGVYRTGHPAELADYEILKGDGTKGFYEMSAHLMRDEEGNPVGFRGITRDVTKRKEMEQALAESEKRYRMIVQNMSEIVWTINTDLRFTYVSPSAVWVAGYTPEETLKTPLQKFLTPESFDLASRKLADELALEASGEPFDPNRAVTLELEAVHKDGHTFWLEISGTFNRDDAGTVTEILVVGKNITERKEVELALAESERRYRMIVENMRDIIWTMDLNLNYTYRSPSNIQITGYTPEEITGTPPRDQITPESYALIEKVLAEELEREFGGEPVDPHRSRTLEVEVYHKDGGTVWIEVTGTFIRDESGTPVEILLAARDITERKRMADELRNSERRYRMIVENMTDMIATVDLNLRYTYQSPSIERVTGYSADELANASAGERITPESRTRVEQFLADALARESRGEPSDWLRRQTIEIETYHKKGGTVWIEITPTFIHDGNGEPTGILVTGRDITDRKRAEEEKDNLEKQLMQAQKMETVGRLAGGVAHDFNNMLSVILGYVDLAKLRLAKEHPVLKDIVEIERAAIRSRNITGQLLAFSRKQIIAPRVVDLNDLVVNAEKTLIRLIGEDIELKVVPGEDLWAVKFDPSQIEQILINLAVNARDAMTGGGKLTIETGNIVLDDYYCENHAGFRPGSYVRMSVSDNGEGMDQETLQHIFEPFFTTKEPGRGTGLGLATVYGIVKQNEGFINVYSEPGHGTTFNIYVPRTTEKRKVQKETLEEPAVTGEGNILLVEDDPMVLEITKGMLESIGYSVIVAETPRDAVSICEKPDIPLGMVISDVVMPNMSGKELRTRLIEIRPGIKVLFMSGYPADVIAHHGVLEEGVHFLQKPFRLRDLARKVREIMTAD